MKLTDMTKEELSLLTYVEIAYRYLKENNVTLKTPDLFRKVCDLLEFNDAQYASKIGDFYTTLTMDKRFIVLDNNEWDLREHHSVEIVIDDDEEVEDEVIDEPEEEVEEEENEEESLENVDDVVDSDLDDDDDLDDLTIIGEDEIEE